MLFPVSSDHRMDGLEVRKTGRRPGRDDEKERKKKRK